MGPNPGLTAFRYRHRLQLEMLQTFAFLCVQSRSAHFTRECGKSHDSAIPRRRFVGFSFPKGRNVVVQNLAKASHLEDQRKAPVNKGPGVLDSIVKEAIRCKRLQTIPLIKGAPQDTTVEDGLTYVASELPRPRSLIIFRRRAHEESFPPQLFEVRCSCRWRCCRVSLCARVGCSRTGPSRRS